MTQSNYWRFDINNQQSQGSSGSSNQAFVIVEGKDESIARQNAQQILSSGSSNLGTPTKVSEDQARQYQQQMSQSNTATA